MSETPASSQVACGRRRSSSTEASARDSEDGDTSEDRFASAATLALWGWTSSQNPFTALTAPVV